jgi:hypothetical protein
MNTNINRVAPAFVALVLFDGCQRDSAEASREPKSIKAHVVRAPSLSLVSIRLSFLMYGNRV